ASLLKKSQPVSLSLKNARLEEALNAALENQPLTYSITANAVIIKPKTVAGPIDVKGKVLGDNGSPLSGVTVKVKGTSKVTTTDDRGQFVLTKVDEHAILQFSYVGFETSEALASANLNAVKLQKTNSNLDEVV